MLCKDVACPDTTFVVFHVVQNVEQGLLEQIAYLNEVSTTHAHEGSAYGEEKVRIKDNKY